MMTFLNNIKYLFLMQIMWVFCELDTECLYFIYMHFRLQNIK